MFLFNTQEMELNPVDVHNPEARWVLPEEVCTYLTHYKDKQFFRQYLKSHSVHQFDWYKIHIRPVPNELFIPDFFLFPIHMGE